MKYLKTLISAAILTTTLTLVHAETLAPGQIDFGEFSPSASGGEFVEVNISSTLISLAARFIEKEDSDIAKLLNGLQLVRVNVIGLDDGNRVDMTKRVQKVRKQLDTKGWERIVTAQKKDKDVSIYLKTQDKESVQGLAIVVLEGTKQAVFVNIVGDIKPEQLAMLGEKLHIEPLKKISSEIGN